MLQRMRVLEEAGVRFTSKAIKDLTTLGGDGGFLHQARVAPCNTLANNRSCVWDAAYAQSLSMIGPRVSCSAHYVRQQPCAVVTPVAVQSAETNATILELVLDGFLYPKEARKYAPLCSR